MYYLLILIILNHICMCEVASTQENNAMCAMVTSIPLLASNGWICPTNDSCNWNTPTIKCSTGGNVTSLTLTIGQVSGTIPTQIGQLKCLTSIDIGSEISGTIPSQLSQITSLQYLEFGNNQVTGTIPTQIGQLKYLSTLIFTNIQITGTIPTQLSQITTLYSVSISSIQLSGTIPTLTQNTNLQILEISNTQLCGCPQLPNINTICFLSGITIPCKCTVPNGCSVSTCNNTFNCSATTQPSPSNTPQPSPIVSSIPLSIPSIKPTPQPGPAVASTPLSIPSIQFTPQPSSEVASSPLSIPSIYSTPQPNPDVGCQGNYGTLFTCKDRKWTSSTDVVLNGTNLSHSVFNLSTVIVNGNMLISESSINIVNLLIQKYSVLNLQNCSLFVSGDLYLNPQSTIILNTNNNFTVNHCAFLDGTLVIITHQSQTLKWLPILNSQCINGTFSYQFVTDNSQCNVVVPHLEQFKDSLSVFVNQCNSELSSIYIIIIGIVGFLLLLAMIVSAFLIWRRLRKRQKKIDKLCQDTTQ